MSTESFIFVSGAGMTALDAIVAGTVPGTATTQTITVPAGKPNLTAVQCVFASDGAVVSSWAGVAIIKGNGLVRSAQIPIGAAGATLATNAAVTVPVSFHKDMGIQCIPGNSILVDFQAVGEGDSGTAEGAITLIFSNRAPKIGWMDWSQAREVATTVVDVAGRSEFEGLGTAAASKVKVPSDAMNGGRGALEKILLASASDLAGTGGTINTTELTGSGTPFDQSYISGSSDGTNATAGNGQSATYMVDELEIDVVPNNEITLNALTSGVDTGSTTHIISLGFLITGR